VRLAKPKPTTYSSNNNNNEQQVALPGTVGHHGSQTQTAVHLQPAAPEYIAADEDGGSAGMLCRWQFDVSGYDPNEINVKVDGGMLLVSARHADVKDADNTSSRQLSKQVEIPRDVNHAEMTSYMTRDGVLVIQAPVASGTTSHVTPPGSRTRSAGVKVEALNGADQQALDCRFRPIELPPEQPPSDDVIAASRRHVIKTGESFYKMASTTSSGSKTILQGGQKTIYQLRPHLSQIHTTKYMPFTRKKAAFCKQI